VGCFLESISLDPNCNRILDDKSKMLKHHEWILHNKVLPIFQQAVNEDARLNIEARAQITAAVDAMLEAIVRFDTRLGNISYFASGHVKRKGDL
jgi:hypothetical protein